MPPALRGHPFALRLATSSTPCGLVLVLLGGILNLGNAFAYGLYHEPQRHKGDKDTQDLGRIDGDGGPVFLALICR